MDSARRRICSFFLRLTSRFSSRGRGGGASLFYGGDWSLLWELSKHALQERQELRAERREADLPHMMCHINNSHKILAILCELLKDRTTRLLDL